MWLVDHGWLVYLLLEHHEHSILDDVIHVYDPIDITMPVIFEQRKCYNRVDINSYLSASGRVTTCANVGPVGGNGDVLMVACNTGLGLPTARIWAVGELV
jgi:hypothetical protein